MPRLLGIDYGTRRIGLAISDESGRLAVGLATWPNEGAATVVRLKQLMGEKDIRHVVVGYPLTLRGQVGPKAAEVDAFIHRLERVGIPVERWDERWTTQEVSRTARAAGLSEKKQRGRLDMAAAVVLLQNYLDAHLEHPIAEL
ncbi:MAG: Holliday junction resolvase RuvX [Calditrichaeota bacterium]|nr:Holliday junction resolvase RuvX [Calditrichota bacterium]